MNIRALGFLDKNKTSFGDSKVNVLLFNDLHANIDNIDSFKTVYDKFEKDYERETKLVFSGGDNFIDKAENNAVINNVFGEMLDASSVGNHDLESFGHFFADKEASKFSWVSINLKNVTKTIFAKPVQKSRIIERNGEKIGVIGISPFDYGRIAFQKRKGSELDVYGLSTTLKALKKEVKKLEDKGVEKIFLLAHTGEKSNGGKDYYKEFSKIGGIDVIIGGHDHNQVDRWERSERNEPVKIVSTGRTKHKKFAGNLDSFGILNLMFNDKGVLIKSKTKNSFEQTTDYPKSDFLNRYLDKSEFKTIFTLSAPIIGKSTKINENKVASLVADADLFYVNSKTKGKKADFAFVSPGSIRGDFDCKDVSVLDVKKIVPFVSSTLIKTTLTKKQIVDTLNWCVQSTSLPKIMPGIMQVSGMTYVVQKDGKVKNVCIVDKNGVVKTRLDDVPNEKEFVCVYDTLLATGVAGLKDLKKDFDEEVEKGNVECFDASRQFALKEYLETLQGNEIYDLTYPRISFGRSLSSY